MDSFCGSKFWDLNTTWNTGQPDLTPCFEKTVLVWIPAVFLLISLPIEIYCIIRSRERNIPWNWLNILKVLLLVVLLLLCLVNCVYASQKDFTYRPDFYASIVRGVSFCIVLILVLYNRTRGMQISGVQFIFWFLMVIFGGIQLRTTILHTLAGKGDQFDSISYVIYYVIVCVNFLLQFFADKVPRYSERIPLERPCPEKSSSFPSQMLFSWFTQLIMKGSKDPLTQNDLWNLSHENSSMEVVPAFEKYWQASVLENAKSSKAFYSPDNTSVSFSPPSRKKVSIVPALCKAFGPTFLVASLIRLAVDLLNFMNPQILRLLINFVSSDDFAWKGYFYACSFLVITSLQSIMLAHYHRVVSIVGMRIRCALVTAIFKKSLKLSNSARKDSSIGKIVNLMAVDAQHFHMLMLLLNMIWSAPLQVTLALYFIWDLMGVSVFMGVLVLIFLIPINGFLINYSKRLQVRQMKYKDERIKLMNEILSGIKVLKLYAWEPSFEKQVLSIREKELKILKKVAYVNAVTVFLWSCVPFIVAFTIFSAYILIDKNNLLTPDKAFVAISLINIIRFPLSIFPMLISSLVMTSVSVKRINNFMNSDELDTDAINRDQGATDPIVVENGTFSWDGHDSKNVSLKNINLKVKYGALIAIVGSVGTGKSSLVSALLGEMNKISGYVNIKGRVAYVSQQAWLQNATLKDNILFGRDYDKMKYEKTIKACALEQDLEMLPGGDLTEIGEKGINLSGGQKQRVSLARAVYSDADLYFLDDPLSAVDSHVGKHIFENVIGAHGMIKDKTRILVTHAVTYLPEADQVLVMNGGKITERGTYKELLAMKGAFADFLVQYMQESLENEEDEDVETLRKQLLEYDGELPTKLSRQLSQLSSTESVNRLSRGQSLDSKINVNKVPHERGDKLIVAESLETGQVNWRVYKYYFKAIGSFLAISTIVLIAAFHSCTVGSNAWISVWSNDVEISVNGTNTFSKQLFYLEIYAVFGVGQVVTKLLSSICGSLGGLCAARFLQAMMLSKVLHLPMSFFDTTPLGRIVNRFSKDVDTVDNTLPNNLLLVLNFSIQLIATICVIAYTTPMFIIVIIPIAILNFSIQRSFIPSARQIQRLESVTKSPVYSHFSESLAGVQTIRAYGVQDAYINQCEKNLDTNFSCFYLSVISIRWISVRLESLGNLVVFFAALFAVLSKDTMNAGLVGLSVTYALQITSMLFMLVRETTNLETNTVSVERIKEYSELPEEAEWYLEPKPDPDWPQKGVIEFRDYAVSYRKGLDLVLKGITCKIKSGEKVGIVGQTGAGKSSLTLALFRLLEANRGHILIDNVDISKLGLHDLRSTLTIIPQDPVLFSGTLRVNLDPFELHKDDSVWYALELAHLKTFVLGLPAGLHHQMSEGGENLSVGQRQLICLARALLHRSQILILDEATAAVDLETDNLIQQTIRLVFKESTVLTIAHRLNTIMDYDRVLVIDKGLVAEYDTPENLLNSKNSKFYQLARDAGIVQ